MNQDICFLNEDREARTAVIFDPLLGILSSALLEAPEEVCINYSRVTPGCISAFYAKAGKRFPLHVETNFSPADVFVRLRIICGMSIAAEGHQTGETMMRFQNRAIKVLVEMDTEEKQETISLKFDLHSAGN
jgi:hypothetical protein